MMSKWYLGRTSTNGLKPFKADVTPTRETHGEFRQVIGPYTTRRAAILAAAFGYRNPQLRLHTNLLWHAAIMSDTPRTDALERELEAAAPGRTFDAMVELCRELERESDNYKFRLSEQQDRQEFNMKHITERHAELMNQLQLAVQHIALLNDTLEKLASLGATIAICGAKYDDAKARSVLNVDEVVGGLGAVAGDNTP
jgi:hypothetical protein